MNTYPNALPSQLFSRLVSTISHSEFPWYFNSTAYEDVTEPLLGYSYSHLAWKDGQSNSPIGPMIETIFLMLADTMQQDVDQLIRVRIGSIGVTSTPHRHTPHVDLEYPHQTALLYLNDSDGSTELYDQFYDNTSQISNQDYFQSIKNNISLAQSIVPEANKIVCFDGLRYHSSETPINVPRRLVINFNYTLR
jgi:hypothetical protein